MHVLSLLLVAARLTCWPFEVEGQGEGRPGAPDREARSSSTLPAPPGAPVAGTARLLLPASLPRDEVARYDVRYGVLGTIGELTVSASGVSVPSQGAPMVTLRGAGKGAVLGLGGIERRIEAEFDVRALGSRRWTMSRRKQGQRAEDETVDSGERNDRGENRLTRRAPGKPDEAQSFRSVVLTTEPLGMLWRLRTAPPAPGQSEVIQLLDGLALWRVRATTASLVDPVPDLDGRVGLRIEGEVTPIYYDGRVDPERTGRRFTLWLDPRASHLPLRLEVPLGPADVVMQLIQAQKRLATDRAQVGAPLPGARSL